MKADDYRGLESKARAALAFQPEPPDDGWPDGEPEFAPAWDATSGWLEDGGHQESDGATVLSLVAEVRRARRLESAAKFMARHGFCLYRLRSDEAFALEDIETKAEARGWKETT